MPLRSLDCTVGSMMTEGQTGWEQTVVADRYSPPLQSNLPLCASNILLPAMAWFRRWEWHESRKEGFGGPSASWRFLQHGALFYLSRLASSRSI